MNYVPQFETVVPPGFRARPFSYYFDVTNLPVLGTLTAGAYLRDIPLVLDSDAPWVWCGFATILPALSVVGLRWKDAFGNYLSSGYVPIGLLRLISYSVIEPSCPCPAGGILSVSLHNSSALSAYAPALRLDGYKLFPEACHA